MQRPYGTYVIDLRKPEEVLWKNVDRITRQNIGTAQRDGVSVREGAEFLEPAYDLIRETFARSEMAFMDRDAFERFAHGLGQHGKVLMAEYRGAPQSYCLFGFSVPSAYAIYAGNVQGQHQGANKLLYWEAIRRFRALGTRTLDFAGARIKPEKGSKQDGINALKRRLGATLLEGYMWKYPSGRGAHGCTRPVFACFAGATSWTRSAINSKTTAPIVQTDHNPC